MTKTRRIIAIAVLGLALPGCFRGTIETPLAREPAVRPHQDTDVSWVYGLTEAKTVAANCQHGIARASAYWPWWGPLVYGITLGIVTPIRMEYDCAAEPKEDGQRP